MGIAATENIGSILIFNTEGSDMGGIQYLTDAAGNKTAAVIDLKTHKALWEDIQDVLVSRSRSKEKGVSLAKVKAALVANGKLRG